jgi:hypothetical protein
LRSLLTRWTGRELNEKQTAILRNGVDKMLFARQAVAVIMANAQYHSRGQ